MTVLAGSEMEPRWRMQETLREFAEEKLTLSGRADEARRALPTLFRRSGTRTTFHSTSIEKSEMDQLAKEYDNTHSALNWARNRGRG